MLDTLLCTIHKIRQMREESAQIRNQILEEAAKAVLAEEPSAVLASEAVLRLRT